MPCRPPRTVQLGEHRAGRQALAVDRDDVALRVGELDVLGLRRRLLGRHGDPPHRLLGLVGRVLEDAALVRDVEEVGVHGVGRAAALLLLELDRDAVLLRVLQQLLARGEVPLAPRRDDLDVGHQRVGAELEADLVVALAGRAVRDRVGPGLARDLDQVLRDQRARDRRAEQVLALVDRVRAEHREHEVAHELLAQVLDEDLLHAEQLRLPARRLELLALADVGGEGDDLAAVGVHQPLQDDRGVEPAGVGEHHLLHFALALHASPFPFPSPVTFPSTRIFHQRLLDVQPVLRLVPDHALRTVDHVGGDLLAAVGRAGSA